MSRCCKRNHVYNNIQNAMHNNAFKSNCVLLQLHPKMQCSSDVMSLHTGCRFAALSGGLPCLWLSCKTVCPMQKKPKQISFSQTSIAYLHGIFLPNFRILQLKKKLSNSPLFKCVLHSRLAGNRSWLKPFTGTVHGSCCSLDRRDHTPLELTGPRGAHHH